MSLIAVGATPADFALVDHTGATVRLADLRGKPLVVFMYPKADTPGCTKEACAFRDLAAEFERRGARVVGLSADAVKSQAKFVQKYGLTMPLLADPDKAVLVPWGVWGEKKNYGKTYEGIVRTTVLMDAAGVVRHVWSPVKVDGHADAVLARLDELGLSG